MLWFLRWPKTYIWWSSANAWRRNQCTGGLGVMLRVQRRYGEGAGRRWESGDLETFSKWMNQRWWNLFRQRTIYLVSATCEGVWRLISIVNSMKHRISWEKSGAACERLSPWGYWSRKSHPLWVAASSGWGSHNVFKKKGKQREHRHVSVCSCLLLGNGVK